MLVKPAQSRSSGTSCFSGFKKYSFMLVKALVLSRTAQVNTEDTEASFKKGWQDEHELWLLVLFDDFLMKMIL